MSSESITLADFKTRRARKVISSRFPIGVATRYNPGSRGPRFEDCSRIKLEKSGEVCDCEQEHKKR